MAETKIEADVQTNRLYIRLAGKMENDEAEAAAKEVKAGIEKLESGFDIINDLAEFKPTSGEAVAYVEEAKTYAADAGCAAVVRIEPESPTGKMQFERAEGENYEVAVAETVEKAEKLLDKRREK
jgi:predicted xylose isomerase-like sugar epimerase